MDENSRSRDRRIQPESNPAPEGGQVERIRNIIVGDQVKALEDRLIRVDRSLDREVEALQDEVRRLRSDLTGLIQGELTTVREEFSRRKTEIEHSVSGQVEDLHQRLENRYSTQEVEFKNKLIADEQNWRELRSDFDEKLAGLAQSLEVLKAGQAGLGDKLRELETGLSGHSERLGEIKDKLKSHSGELSGQKQEISGLKGNVANLEGDVSTLKENVNILKVDAVTLKEDQAAQGVELGQINDRLSTHSGELSGIKTDLKAQAKNLAQLTRGQADLENGLADLKEGHVQALGEMRQRMVRHLVFYHSSLEATGDGPPLSVSTSLEAEAKKIEH